MPEIEKTRLRLGWTWLLLSLLTPSANAADVCDKLPPPSVTVQRLDEQLVENTTYSYRALNELGASLARPGQQVLGLTRGNAVARFTLRLPSYIESGGRWECASPQVTLAYGLQPLTVYVAREFPRGSCAFRAIHAHEMQHVRFFREHIAAIESTLTEALRQRFTTASPWRAPAGQTLSQLQRELEQRWTPFVQREIAKGDERQATIDTPEEYRRITEACDGEIAQRLKGQ